MYHNNFNKNEFVFQYIFLFLTFLSLNGCSFVVSLYEYAKKQSNDKHKSEVKGHRV